MVANHVALTLPQPWREAGILLGRASLPLFSLLIVLRLQHDTEARATRYLTRLLVWGMIAQPFYVLLLSGWSMMRFNALFTLASGVCLIYLARVGNIWLAALGAGVVVMGTAWLDGGAWMPLAQLLAWYWLKQRPGNTWAAVGIIAVMASGMNMHSLGQISIDSLVVLVALPLIIAISPRLSQAIPRLPGLVFYGFYPVHLAVIYAIHGPY